MKILQVIHGYPMRYNAGSEVYTQTLAQALAERHEVHVFTREENPFAPDYALRDDADPGTSSPPPSRRPGMATCIGVFAAALEQVDTTGTATDAE